MIPLPKDVNHILYAILNWGLGHATRSIPVIDFLLSKNIKVTIASDGEALVFLKREYPELDYIELKSYGVRYRGKNLAGIIIQNFPNVFLAILSEGRKAKKAH